MTALVRRPERQEQDLEQIIQREEFASKRETRLKTTLTVVLSINMAFVFAAITLAALLARS